MVTLYVGGVNRSTIQGEFERSLIGNRCFSPALASSNGEFGEYTQVLLDSGAFTDKPERRLTLDRALDRQLAWEARYGYYAKAIVSYDMLVDELWVGGEKHKQRWSLEAAEYAVQETIEAARYLTTQRHRISGCLVLSVQGVDSIQYAECASEILRNAQPSDWLGLGGWCILGRNRKMLNEFWRTIYTVVPMAAQNEISHIHIFGVLWDVALGGLQWLCDQYNIELSTDSAAPIIACTYPDMKKAGVRKPYWRDNVEWWRAYLASLSKTQYYCKPPEFPLSRQLYFYFRNT